MATHSASQAGAASGSWQLWHNVRERRGLSLLGCDVQVGDRLPVWQLSLITKTFSAAQIYFLWKFKMAQTGKMNLNSAMQGVNASPSWMCCVEMTQSWFPCEQDHTVHACCFGCCCTRQSRETRLDVHFLGHSWNKSPQPGGCNNSFRD